jgi:Kyakuja-Dileera-Zisupton transposase
MQLYTFKKESINILFEYNLLPNYSHRITFGVSVFHAFGHEFSCQCIYHPQKRVGFGCTDGEGCERVWNQLLKEIPMLRVSGVRHILLIGSLSSHYITTNSTALSPQVHHQPEAGPHERAKLCEIGCLVGSKNVQGIYEARQCCQYPRYFEFGGKLHSGPVACTA